jgi:hypothetical protein
MKLSTILRRGLFLSLFVFTWSGCMPPGTVSQSNVLVLDVQSTNCPKIDQCFVYENDTISVTYSFWEKNGTIETLIRNKLNRPIYIDWKKCSFITGETKHDYWDGAMTMTMNGSAFQTLENFYNRETTWSSIAQISEPERISFIPPGTIISMAMHTIAQKEPANLQPDNSFSIDTTLLMKQEYTVQLTHPDSTVTLTESVLPQQFRLLSSRFDTLSTPLSFRLFITYSTDEKFSTEAYIDHFFYVSQITQMPMSAFKAVKDKKLAIANINQGNFWASPSSFYIFNDVQ